MHEDSLHSLYDINQELKLPKMRENMSLAVSPNAKFSISRSKFGALSPDHSMGNNIKISKKKMSYVPSQKQGKLSPTPNLQLPSTY